MKNEEIKPEDIVVQSWQSKPLVGFGIDKLNGVRITHIPTRIVIECDSERSQHKNMAIALDMLKEKIADARNNKGS